MKLAWLILMCCSPAIASEKYILSASTGRDLILKSIVLDQGLIRTEGFKLIPTRHFIFNTAVTARRPDKRGVVFDVYYATCLDPNDIFCDHPTLSITRLDSNMNVQFSKDLDIQTWTLSTESIEKESGFESRLLFYNGYSGRVSERKLRPDGQLAKRIELNTDFGAAPNPIAAEDGKMAVGTDGASILVWQLRAGIPISSMHSKDFSRSPVLSGPVARTSTSSTSGSLAKARRFLFFRTFRDLGQTPTEPFAPKSRILRQMINDSTGDFVGQPQTFIDWEPIEYVDFSQSLAVTPKANILLYGKYDLSCKKQILMAQVYEPLKKQKVGPSQVLIACEELSNTFFGVQGIDIAPVP